MHMTPEKIVLVKIALFEDIGGILCKDTEKLRCWGVDYRRVMQIFPKPKPCCKTGVMLDL